MFRNALLALAAAGALFANAPAAGAQMTMASKDSFPGLKMGPEHGMPQGMMGEGPQYTGAPDLQATISLVTVGNDKGKFSIVKALTNFAGADTANAEVAKLVKQYGKPAVDAFVTVEDFAVDDAVQKATAAGVKFPKPEMSGKPLATRVVTLGLDDGTFYIGTALDHLLTHDIHEAVMGDIDLKYGMAADANYHRVANQALYDLAHALGVTTVKLAAYH